MFFFLPKRHVLLFFFQQLHSEILPSSDTTSFMKFSVLLNGYTKGIRILEIQVHRGVETHLVISSHFIDEKVDPSSHQLEVESFCPQTPTGPGPCFLTYSEHILSLWLVCKLLETRTVSFSSWCFSECKVHLP